METVLPVIGQFEYVFKHVKTCLDYIRFIFTYSVVCFLSET